MEIKFFNYTKIGLHFTFMKKAFPVPNINLTSRKDFDSKRLDDIERRIQNIERRLNIFSDSDDDEPPKKIQKIDSYSDLEPSDESDSLPEPDPEANDEKIVKPEIWNMRPGEKVKIYERINNSMMDFVKTLSPRQREKGMTIDQLRRKMEKFFNVRLSNNGIGNLYNFPKYFYHKRLKCGKTTLFLYFYKNQLE